MKTLSSNAYHTKNNTKFDAHTDYEHRQISYEELFVSQQV